MKYSNSRAATQFGRLAKTVMVGGAAFAFLGLSMNAQADPVCTVENWTDAPGLSDADTGTQGSDNRRYGGPCGLRVNFDDEARFVTYESGQGEAQYIARFYAFLNDMGSDAAIIFAGTGGGDDQVQIWYNFPSANDLTLRAFDASGVENDLTFSDVGSGWHSIEFDWDRDSGDVVFLVNSEDDEASMNLDLSGLSIEAASLGNVAAADTGGVADFDDFDSRRSTRPGRLMAGDANDDGVINVSDIASVVAEIDGIDFAAGQPDCNEDGAVNVSDIACVVQIIDAS